MPTQITNTDDVLSISLASNVDGTIRWHVYERVKGTGSALYVQREVDHEFETEVEIVPEGGKPRITFDHLNSVWVLLYVLNENVFMLQYTETELPTGIAEQNETAVNHFVGHVNDGSETQTIAQRAAAARIGVKVRDAYNGPPAPVSTAIAANPTPGYVNIRWQPTLRDDVRIAGFRVWRKNASNGALVSLTGIVPYEGVGVHEAAVPYKQGTYYVTQVHYKGDSDTDTTEGRVLPPGDTVSGDLVSIEAFMDAKMGEGFTLRTEKIDAGIVLIIVPGDQMNSQYRGEGFNFTFENPQEIVPIVLPTGDTQSLFNDRHTGEGFVLRVQRTGLGSVIIG